MQVIQVIFGSRVSPLTGQDEAKIGRVTIYQELIPELDGPEISPDEINCLISGPKPILDECQSKLGWQPSEDAFGALLFKGDTAAALEALKSIWPDLEGLNSDDDEVFATKISPE